MFTLTIQTDNAAFEDAPGEEVARILEETAAKLRNMAQSGNLRDINGNKVGTFELS